MDSKGHRSWQAWPGHGLGGAGIAVTALTVVIAITLASEVAVVSAAPPGGNYYNSGTRQGLLSNEKIFGTPYVQRKDINTQGFKSHLQGNQRDDGGYSGGHMHNSKATDKTKFPPTLNKKDASGEAIRMINTYGQNLGSWKRDESNGYYVLIAKLDGESVRIVVRPGGPGVRPLLKTMYPLENQNQQGASGRQG